MCVLREKGVCVCFWLGEEGGENESSRECRLFICKQRIKSGHNHDVPKYEVDHYKVVINSKLRVRNFIIEYH